jgi:hypothetical protein
METAPPKRKLTEDELWAHLAEQIGFLETSAKAFDDGATAEAKRLAVTIRVLVRNTRHSKSLIGQLNLDHLPFLSSVKPFDIRTTIATLGLVSVKIDPETITYVPKFAGFEDAGVSALRQLNFSEWWTEPVFSGRTGAPTRRSIILSAADQDGGAHVDPSINSAYDELVRSGLGIAINREGEIPKLLGDPTKAAIRQIAFEVLHTLRPYSAFASKLIR